MALELSKLKGIGLIGGIFVFSACKDDGSQALFWEIERERIEMAQKLELAEYRLGLIVPGDLSELNQLNASLFESEEKLRTLRTGRIALADEVSEMDLGIQELYRLFIERQRANSMGRTFDSLSIKDGRTFKNVSITGVNDGGVAIRHEHGAATLRYGELSAEHREMFGLQQGTALAAEESERREAVAYERTIERELEVLREKEELAAISASRNDGNRISRSLLARSSNTREAGALSKPPTPFGSGSIWRSYDTYRYRSYRPTFRYVYYYPTTRNPYCSPRSYRSVMDERIVPRVAY